jgi:methyl-accepting chemotaxis protein
MFMSLSSESREWKSMRDAINKSFAVIEFKLDGTIITANENFLSVLGYSLSEVQGQHHSMFVEPAYKESQEYRNFWECLNRGEHQSAEFKRIGKGGREVWIQASYNPLLDTHGKPYKVVKFATDVTEAKLEAENYQNQIDAISRSQAVIEFDMNGVILAANENFLAALGYTLSEIQGAHHSMFVEPDFKESPEYRDFWERLNEGKFQSAEYKRLGKGGREVWIQASYNPLLDAHGKPYKVVKFATDITEQMLSRQRNERVQKVIVENLTQIDEAISQAANQSTNAASASAQTSGNVQAVAAGAEELDASVREIADSMAKSRLEAEAAVESTQVADEAAERLAQATKSMGGIVDLINEITAQIDLLALNATIEAARAGEAGRGFAVVASEVKNLSRQAKDATDRIAQEVNDTCSISTEVVNVLSAIRESIGTLREYVTSTASAVEEQSIVAGEMSNNMQSASTAVDSLTQNINEIAKAAGDADSSNKRVREAAQDLAASA